MYWHAGRIYLVLVALSVFGCASFAYGAETTVEATDLSHKFSSVSGLKQNGVDLTTFSSGNALILIASEVRRQTQRSGQPRLSKRGTERLADRGALRV
jgi:hypothetical protein